ncbi:Uncharacterized protein Adt_20370 [Abeliophyllum distichum]|uniref:Uncharacterized protein n=1 Tax=Abeliophyllum distichum TaxID=126358 RepID=A0ABD1SWD5_9LAMI
MPPLSFRPPSSETQRFRMMSYKDAAQSTSEKIPDRFASFGKIHKIKEENTLTSIHLQDFLTLEAEARIIGASAPEETYYGTFEKKFRQFIFIDRADPTLVQTTFHCRLIKMIIPGDELEEIKLINSQLYQSLKDFKKFVIKDQDTKLILRINSTIPFWAENKILYKGYHHNQIKTVHEIFLDIPIEGQPSCVNELILQDWRALSYQRILTGLKAFDRESKIKINHSSKFVLMTSRTSSTISTEGIRTLCNFEKNFYNLVNTPPSYTEHMCKALKSSLGKYHECQ